MRSGFDFIDKALEFEFQFQMANAANDERGKSMSELISGYKVIESEHILESTQVRFPRSKKKRIRKKWAKNLRYFEQRPMLGGYVSGDTLMIHPAAAKRLRALIAKAAAEKVDQAIRFGSSGMLQVNEVN